MANVKTNIKVNYMLLEQILRITGTYKNLCHDYDFLDDIFKQAKTGDFSPLASDNNLLEIAFGSIAEFTGVAVKYWSGKERIKLGIRCKKDSLNLDGSSIDTVDLSKDGFDKKISESAYHGVLYQEQLKNPLHLDTEEICLSSLQEEVADNGNGEAEMVVGDLYSLRGLLTVLLLNIENKGGIDIIDKANVYRHKNWQPYVKILDKATKEGITYSPKYIEIKKGLVQTIIKNVSGLGYDSPLRKKRKRESEISQQK